jgi:hypothetical protein
MSQLDKDAPHLADILRRATLEKNNQDKRLADIFGTQTVPKVTEETLAIYLDYLKQHLEVPCQLTGIESRGCFAWSEASQGVCPPQKEGAVLHGYLYIPEL